MTQFAQLENYDDRKTDVNTNQDGTQGNIEELKAKLKERHVFLLLIAPLAFSFGLYLAMLTRKKYMKKRNFISTWLAYCSVTQNIENIY